MYRKDERESERGGKEEGGRHDLAVMGGNPACKEGEKDSGKRSIIFSSIHLRKKNSWWGLIDMISQGLSTIWDYDLWGGGGEKAD